MADSQKRMVWTDEDLQWMLENGEEGLQQNLSPKPFPSPTPSTENPPQPTPGPGTGTIQSTGTHETVDSLKKKFNL